MTSSADRAVAIVGVGAILPDAPDAIRFWDNLRRGHYAISDVDAARWDPALYYDDDPRARDRTYSKIGGWVRDWEWNPLGWKLPIPPRVGEAMDDAQKWAVACTRMALMDYGRPVDNERTAVILGNAMAGEKHYQSSLRLMFPELSRDLDETPSFAALPAEVRAAITGEWHARLEADLPPTTEDTMPGELGNCLAGRVANLFNLRGPNFIVDAACASAMAAMDSAIEGLIERQFDTVVTGGVDRNMSVASYIKFCAIGALSATGTRPYADGADGFVMGEGAGLFLLKRLADAERDGDRIYAVVRGMAGSSDGRGKGITAPNPIGQKLAIERAWQNAGLSPAECSMLEGHGTSTSVGDYVELSSLVEAFAHAGLAPGSIALGSVKSNIGHLKAAAGAAGLLKTTLALHHKTLPPSLGFARPNPNVDWASTPFAVNTQLRDWDLAGGATRVAGVSAFGFGGTNFHAVLEEYVPGRFNGHGNGHATIAVPAGAPAADQPGEVIPPPSAPAPARGAFLAGAADIAGLAARLRAPMAGVAPKPEDLAAPERVCIDYGDAVELAAKAAQALKALESGNPAAWKALQGRGIYRGSGAPGKVAFLYTGQGSQYANMLAELRRTEPIVAATFDEADAIMRPLLGGRALSDIIFVGPEGVAEAEAQLMRTEITQPAVLTVDVALTRLLAERGIAPDFVMGHSLGEYGALVAAGVLPFASALEAVSARGSEMANLSVEDNGAMAAVSAPIAEVERIVAEVDGYVVLANVNSNTQLVIGGATRAVERAIELIVERGHRAQRLPVSHAFHTEIVAPAGEPLRATLRRMSLSPPRIPIVANVDGEFYPFGPDVEERIIDILGRQVASPVQFVKGLQTLYDAGARVFVETGPKRALWGFAADVLGDDVMTLFTNHPKVGELPSFNQALCGLYAAGVGARPEQRPARPDEPVVITGAAVGTPGTERVFDDGNLARLLAGEQFIDVIPTRARREIAEHHITRLVKSEDGSGTFQTIDDPADVIKLAGRAGSLDLAEEFGIDADRLAALGRETQLAIAAGIDALRDAGIPLVQHYKDTTRGTKLPDHWRLPDALRDDTGVIFASAFPGVGDFAADMEKFWSERVKHARLQELTEIRGRTEPGAARDEIDRRIGELERELAAHPYHFDRRFLFRVLSMGHSQMAELIGARGPNTQINAACASTTQAVSVAEDWIRTGRCRRVLVVAADDVTSDTLLPWVGSGFLATGAAATDEDVEKAALPFDQRRHGTILGMGAVGIVVESAEAARERGVTPICEVLGAVTANSAFHGSRLDVEHIGGVMESVVRQAEARGVTRAEIAPETVFVSHETFTPARGGSAAAEIFALRRVFGADADRIVVANTKGLTGHAMGVGVEDVVAIKALETGLIPAVPNFRDIDAELGALNLSKGGLYPVRYALRLAAGFGSQISMLLLRWTPVADGLRRRPEQLGYGYRIADEAVWKAWLRGMTGEVEPGLEVVKRTLRVVDTGPVANGRAPSVPAPVATPAPAPSVAPPVAAAPVTAPIAPRLPSTLIAAPIARRTPIATPTAPAAADDITTAILAIVAEQTGYPADMLDPDLDLEADLGIDTVKQAEMFAAIRERYGIARDDNLALRDYPTLRHVAGFVEDRAPTAATPAAPIATPAPAPEPVAAAPAADDITTAILQIVAEQTGYPADMLDPDLDLEADLGIDTVKQAEMFAAIRERYGIARDDNLALRDYPTLRHVAGFVEDRAPTAATPAAPIATPAPAPEPVAAAPAADDITTAILQIVAEQTGYPADMLDPDLDLEADLGIDTVKQAEMFAAIRERYGIARDDNLALRDYPTLRHVAGFVEDRAPTAATPAAPIATPAPAPEPVAAAPTTEEITAAILEIVAAQTGYPADMLDPDLDLEADLGIDTVKQAEMFAAIRERYGIARDDNLALRDYPTLRAVAGFVEDRAPQAAPPAPVEAAPQEPAAPAFDPAAFPRRVPVAVVRPPLEQCEPTGITLGEGSRVIVAADRGGVGTALTARLRKLGVEVVAPEDGGPVDGVYWLPALDIEPSFGELDAEAWRAGLDTRVKRLAALMRDLPETTFLITGTRLGGRHGYDTAGATSVMGGAVTGFAKALHRERPDALVKAVDFAPSRKTAEPADRLIAETLRDPGALEIGYADDLRWTVAVAEEPATATGQTPLTPTTTFVITGAAGSIVAAITADLAGAAGGGTFHLLDLAPRPAAGDPDVARLASDRDGLKLELAQRIRDAGGKPTPKLVERELARIEREAAASQAITAIEGAGGTAIWHAVDLTDAAAVAGALAEAGPVDVLIHAAGLDISHPLASKPQAEYDLVFDVKADGWFNVLRAIGDAPGTAVAFSSIAGRFGNAAQTDYAAANDLLCKAVSAMRRGGATRGIAIDWTAWAEIGMATRGSIPKVMEAAGIAMLPPAVGVPAVRHELESSPGGEVVIAGALGVLLEETPQRISIPGGPISGAEATITVNGGLEIRTELDPGRQAFLDDHRIDGTPVLPGVMGMEAFAETAAALAPGYEVIALEDVELRAPFKFYRDEPRTVAVRTLVRATADGRLAADCELVGRRTLATGEEQTTVHFTGRVLLAREPLPAPPADLPPASGTGAVVEHDAVYRVYFHGPAYQVLEQAYRSNGRVIGRLAGDLPPHYEAAAGATRIVPRLIELCFQTAGVWELGSDGVMGLPTHVDRVLRFAGADAPGRLTAMVRPRPDGAGMDADVVDDDGAVRIRLEGYRTTPLPVVFDDDALAPLRAVIEGSDGVIARPFSRLAVVNRGEAAMRLIHAVREVNETRADPITVIALYTEPEGQAMFVRRADEAYCLGPATAVGPDGRRRNGYLDHEALERALVATRADAVWPGWGFVAEDPAFADLCERLGIVFVGPSGDVMRRLGDKIASKRLAESAGVPVAPWSRGAIGDLVDAQRHARAIGFPLMIKASAGGGGRGIRRVDAVDGLAGALASARAEAHDAFGDDTIFMERLVTPARHIEVQIIADGEGTAWAVGVRDCSCQRRHQKVIEESASPALVAAQEREVSDAARRLALASDYRGAGTVEFLYEPDHRRFSFMEVNARLQVEHPVTEVVTGLDLVKLQLHVAAGGRLAGEPPAPVGHAIEARLCAEDPALGFAPTPGRVQRLELPTGPGIRVDCGLAPGDDIPPEFDSMIAKVIAVGRDRDEALARLRRAVRSTVAVLEDGTTNRAFLLDVLERPELCAGEIDTTWLDRLRLVSEPPRIRGAHAALVQAAIELADAETATDRASFYALARRGRPQARAETGCTIALRHRGQAYRVRVWHIGPGRRRLAVDGAVVEVSVEFLSEHERRLTLETDTYRTLIAHQGADLLVEVLGVAHRITRDDGGIVRSHGPAVVVALPVAAGDAVAAGDVVVVLESMKMELSLTAPFAGRVRQVLVTPNVQVGAHAPLLRLDPLDGAPEPAQGERVTFRSSSPAGDVQRLEWLMLGYDVPDEEAERMLDADLGADEHGLLRLYADLCALVRPRRDATDAEMARSPQEYLHAFLRSLDPRAEHLPEGFITLLERALRHYDIDTLERTATLENACYRLFRSQQRTRAARAVVLAILERHLAAPVAAPGLREVLDELEAAAEGRDAAVAERARELRYAAFDAPLAAAARDAVYAAMDQHLTALAADPGRADGDERVRALIDCPRVMAPVLAARIADAAPRLRDRLLEAMTGRFYRVWELAPPAPVEIDGIRFAVTHYDQAGAHRHLAAAFVDDGALDTALRALAGHAAGLPATEVVVADFYADAPAGSTREELAQRVTRSVRAAGLPANVLRVVVALCQLAPGRGMSAVEIFTLRRDALGAFVEDQPLRGVHPEMAERLRLWRLSEFELERLPSAEDVYLLRGTGRSNPADERLFAVAEVRDLTPVRRPDGEVVALPELERMLSEALEGMRHAQAGRPARARLLWNRVMLYVWPPIDMHPDELGAVIARQARATGALGIEMVLVDGRMRAPDGELRERVLRFFSPTGHTVAVEIDDPPARPLQPLDEGARRVIQARRRGTVHPSELVHLLPGEFVEHDLDGDRLVAVQRPPGRNDAGIVAGLTRTVTERYPEGMLRVALLGDPTKALGSLAEPECRRIIAALDLADELGVPVEWFAISAGARIAMDSGTENMDWIAAVLRRIIEFTQHGGEINIVVTGINVGAQPYWNAEATMLMHTRGILVMTPESAMVLTGKQALDFAGGVSAEDNFGIGGYDRIMGPNGQAQYWAPDLPGACRILLEHYEHTYVAPGERFPRRAASTDPLERDVRAAPHAAPGSPLRTVGDVLSDEANHGRKLPFDIRAVMRATIDGDHAPMERWAAMRDAEAAVVWHAHLGGWPVCLLGIESHPLSRSGVLPADGPDQWTAGTLFPRSAKKLARAINAASGRSPVVVLANLAGFDGSPESMRELQLEFGAEIGRAVVNFRGPIVFCVVSRYHGGAFVVFSQRLNDQLETVAVEGTHASVIGGSAAAAVVFARDVDAAARADERVRALDARLEEVAGADRNALRAERAAVWTEVHAEKMGELAARFDAAHSVERAVRVGSVGSIIDPGRLRPFLIEAIERGMRRTDATDDGHRLADALAR